MKPPSSLKHLSRCSLLIQKNLSNSPKLLFQISHFNTLSSSAGSGNTTSHSNRYRYEEESRNVRVSVWWDFENCHLPVGTNAYRVAQFVAAAIRTNGIKGPIQITAFGDVTQLSRPNQEALSSTGINLDHVPKGGKNSADRSLLVNLMYWVTQNPPPAHLFLISGDRDFAGILHRLRMNNYNILLASPESAPSVLCSAASIIWDWNCLLNGENLSGKHYNRPPDGPFGSWYGHYKAPLEEPFAAAEQPVSSPSEVLPDTSSDSKIRPIPKIVIKQIGQILCSYPKGVPITELRAELSRSSLNIDKDYYGYKKFARFLSALPRVLKLHAEQDGSFLVYGVKQKVFEQVESSPVITSGWVVNGKPLKQTEGKSTQNQLENTPPDGSASSSRSNGEHTISKENEGKSTSSEESLEVVGQKMQKTQNQPEEPTLLRPKLNNSPPERLQEQATAMQEEGREGKEKVAVVDTVNESKEINSQLQKLEESIPSESGFFKRIWGKWFGHKVGDLDKNACTTNGLILPENMKAKEKDVNLATEKVESVTPASVPLSGNDATTDHATPKPSEATSEKIIESSFFSQLIRKLNFWSGLVNSNDSSEEVQENLITSESQSDKSEIFAKESFWDELGAFFDTAEAAAIVMQSATRKQLVLKLHDKGPSILRSLAESKLNHLLEMLISDKKWIDESSSKGFPFKLIRGDAKRSLGNSSGDPVDSNGLSSTFSKTKEPSFSQKQPELGGQTIHPTPSLSGSLPPVSDRKPFRKSEVLADCQKLIDEVLKDRPDGIHVSSFRRLFHEKYGYVLDIQSLGYNKLSFFLHTLSGVTIESSLLLPSRVKSSVEQFQDIKAKGTVSNSKNNATHASRNEDDSDSVWEELGLVSTSGRHKGEKQSGLSLKKKGGSQERINHDYESLSDDYLSESDDDIASSVKSKSKKKPGFDEEDSSLLQVLESWNSTLDTNNTKAKTNDVAEHLDAVPDDSGSDSGESSSADRRVMFETQTNNGRRQRSSKRYTFVADHQPSEDRDKLIDGILGRLKKVGERQESRI